MSSDTEQLYLTEIQLMMYGCGDCSRPLVSTVKVVASIVQQQLLNICMKAEEQAARRCSKTVTPRDIIFLMRKNPDKVARLFRYLSVKEMKNSLSSLMGADLIESTSDEVEADGVIDSAKRNRQASLLEMFTEIDVSGEIMESIKNVCSDPVRLKRDQRADSMAISVDPAGYLDFAKARRASFINSKLTQHRFIEWLNLAIDSSPGLAGEIPFTLPRINSPAIDILAYLAKETVAMLVDFAIQVRQDSSSGNSGGQFRPLTLYTPSSSSVSGGVDRLPLTPAEIREVLRRYWSPVFSQSAALVRIGPPAANQLLAC